jgi:predicted dehydrogenase
MPDPIRLLIVGAGSMARLHAENFGRLTGVEIVAAVDVDEAKLAEFCRQHAIPRSFTSLADALVWGRFDGAANVTPDLVHYPTTMQLLAARRHVFCEKPLAPNYPDAAAMAEAADRAGVVAMVNLTYRNVPALQRARELVLAGELGTVRHVEASYFQSWLTSMHWGDWRTTPAWLWRLSRAHGSNGVLGDIGIHVLDLASYGAATEVADVTCRLKTFDKAEGGRIGDYVLDANDSFVMSVEFENGALGVIHATRLATGYIDDVHLRVFGDRGALEVSFGYEKPAPERVSHLRVCLGEDRHTQTWTEIPLEPIETNYQRFIRAIREGQTIEPSFAHAARLQRLLDQALGSAPPPTGARELEAHR